RNGYWTAPAPPVTFAAAGDNITGIQANNIPIGPPNVIARAIAFTEAGANGVPGASFYTIPEPVNYIVDNVTYTASSLFINDNTTTSATFFFNDAVLLNADEIDVSGNDLFALGELGEAAWCVQYAGRGVWGRVRNKIQNFLNLSFDGGYLANPGSTLLPLGWNVNTATVVAVGNPTLVESAVFGDAYYIQNQGLTLAITNTAATGGVGTYTYTATASGNDPAVGNTVTVTGTTNGSGAFNVTNAAITGVNAGSHTFTIALTGSYSSTAETGQATAYGSTFPALGMIYQSAYQDWELTAILQNQTAYSVRVVCRTPSSATSGALVIDLTAWDANVGFGSTYGTFTLPLAQMTSAYAVYQGTLLLSSTLNIPSDLQLRVWAQNFGPGADLEIDHISVFPTTAPTNLTGLSVSYQDDWESFDLTSGGLDTSTLNAQPANGGFVMHDTLYIVKESSLGYFKDTPNEEPASWQPFQEVSNVAGASGINAWDVGEEWAVMACQNGLFLFNGGQPVPIQLEVPDIWAAINWQYGHTICVRNDVANRRILCAIPLPTPNAWMVDATENSAPTEPNVILALNYKGIGTIDELMAAASMHITMMGDMAVHDLRRKWSLWTIPTPYMGMVKRNELLALMMICNGIASSKIYYLDSTVAGYDDGTPFTSSYCMYGFVDAKEAEQNPIFGQFNKRYAYWDSILTGQGTAALTFYQNTLAAPYPFTVPGGVTLTPAAANDLEGPLNAFAQRLFPEIVMEEGWFSLSRFSLLAAKDRWSVNRGK
ncbi:MAG: hypothetical protein RB191_11325, partial [Terriglobia bacterium]|nr:hypothetical protein [Terriglobia bacterium]